MDYYVTLTNNVVPFHWSIRWSFGKDEYLKKASEVLSIAREILENEDTSEMSFEQFLSKLDIDEAEGGAPVLESRESIYEDTYLLKVGMGL